MSLQFQGAKGITPEDWRRSSIGDPGRLGRAVMREMGTGETEGDGQDPPDCEKFMC